MLVGREREQALLAATLDRAAAGSPALVLVTGEAGIGKTTLVEDFSRAVQRRGGRVVRGGADERDPSGLALWAGPIAALGLTDERFAESAQRPDGRWEAVDLLAAGVDAAAPVIVVLEDIHWADDASVWLLGQLLGSLAGDVVVVATSRESRVGALRPTLTIALDGLSTEDVATIVAQHRSSNRADAERLRERTGGNPLLVGELLAHEDTDARLPPAVGAALQATLTKLRPATARALAVFALAGPQTPYAVVAEALDVTVADLRDGFDEALAANVLVEVSSLRVGFRHALFADAAVGIIEPAEQRRMHSALADAWLRRSEAGDAVTRSATHALRGVPLVDAVEAASSARRAAAEHVGRGDLTGAAQLLMLAIDALELYAASDTELRVLSLIDLGDVRTALGDVTAAMAAYDEAITLHPADPQIFATAVLGAARRMQMFYPDDQRRAELEAAEHGLAPGDHPLRAALLARLAVVESPNQRGWVKARKYAEDAEAMARRLGDQPLLAAILIDRHFGVHDRNDLEGRGSSADELISLGEASRRPDLILVGLQWRYSAALMHADVDGAAAAVDEMATVAALMPSPEWRFGVILRRAMLAAIDGDHVLARRLIDEAAPIGRRVLFMPEAYGVQIGCRSVVARLSGVADPSIGALLDEFATVGEHPPSSFFEIHDAASNLVAGRIELARPVVERWVSVLGDAAVAVESPGTEALLGSLVAELGMTAAAGMMRRRLAAYAGCFNVESGFAVDLPVDLTLMRLAVMDGDLAGASAHFDTCLGIATMMRSPVLEAHSRWHGADVLEATGAPTEAAAERRRATTLAHGAGVVLTRAPLTPADAARPASLRRTGTTWQIESPYGRGELVNTAAIGQLARLLGAAPGEVAAVDLAGMTVVAPASDLGPALDATAKRAYRDRIESLRTEIDEADDHADIERAARARLELDALMTELRRAVGLHGHDRPTNAGAERARVNVARSLRRAIDAVRGVVPELGAHFDVSVRTGRFCTYAPEPATALAWHIQTA